MTSNANEKPPPPLCVYCSAPWTDDMLKAYGEADIENGYYPEEYYFQAFNAVIDVTCSTCKRLVYRKELRITEGDAP